MTDEEVNKLKAQMQQTWAGSSPLVIELSPEETQHLESLLADARDHKEEVYVWVDPKDQAFKIKLGYGVWSPPMGQATT